MDFAPNTLILVLRGPLQSWGERSHWTTRDTALTPTKSGVVGLLGAALGWKTDRLPEIDRALTMGVRVDRPGAVIEDYHTTTSGVVNRAGKAKKDYTLESWRYYLADAAFTVALMGQPEWIVRLAEAVQNPVWPLFLGRKCCPPSGPIFVVARNCDSLFGALVVEDKTLTYEIEGGGKPRHDRIVGNRAFGWRLTGMLTV